MIERFRGQYRFLSNFALSPIEGSHGLIYPTVEHAFQAGKTLGLAERRRIAAAPTPADAKRIGRCVALRSDWAAFRFVVMRAALDRKFALPGFRARLLETGDALLVEGNTWHDQCWGDCDCGRSACHRPGQNWLGHLLMETRATLRK